VTGGEFREARIAAGLSYRQAAAYLGVSLRTIQLWETRDTVPDRATAITNATQVPGSASTIMYQLGRLVAVVEHATGKPVPLTTQRYMEGNPRIGLGMLLSLYHRLPHDARTHDDRIMEIVDVVPPDLPSATSAEERGSFQLGYYHERAALRSPDEA
jgi:transcriptional regulator with XRE-family HTH domain